jgi:signal transduction histidine kinase
MRQRLLILGVGASFAAGVACAFGLDAMTSHRERLEAVERETRNMADLLAEQARQLFSSADQTLRAAVVAYDDWFNDPRGSADTGYRMLKSIKGGSDAIQVLSWFGKSGDRLATSASPHPPPLNIRDTEQFHVHIERANIGMFMASPSQARTRDEIISVVSRRVERPSGEFAGVATAILNMSYFQQVLKRYHKLAGASATLYLRNGLYIAHYPDPEAHRGRTDAHTRLFREELPKAEAGTYHDFAEVAGENRIFSYQAMVGYPIVAQVSIPRALALAPWYDRIKFTGVLGLLAVATAILATTLIYRQARKLEAERQRAVEAQFAAEHASRSKSEFLAHMSHELRTPMNAVIGFTEMMAKEVFGPIGSPKYREYIDDIAASGQHLLQVVNNVLDLAKVEAGKWEMEETTCDLRTLCDSTLQMVRERARTAGVVLSTAPIAPSIAVKGDKRLLRQILINLLTNAIKFTKAGGRVTLWWERNRSGEIALHVSDTGVGMTAEDLRNVLKPFGRGSAELARARHDTGLGLSICRKFSEMHGGRMEIASELGKGTTVTVVLPRERVIGHPERAAAAA